MDNQTYIGIDFGMKRIGLAKSDPMGIIASALKTISYDSLNKAIDEIIGIIEEYEAAGVVVGYPISLSGGDKGERCRMVDGFISKFKEKYDGPIHLIDERFSSSEAERMIHAHGKKIGRDKGRVDRAAAAIILQKFLDSQ